MNSKMEYLRRISFALFLIFISQIAFGQTEKGLDDGQTYVQYVLQQFNEGKWEVGKKTLDEGIKKYPRDSDLRMLAGKYYDHKGNNDKARYELVKAIQLNPNNVDAKQILINVEMKSQRYSSAICYVNELLEVNPYWKGLWRKKIQLYKLQGNIVEANRLQERITQIYPDDQELKKDFIYSVEQEANSKRKEGDIDVAIEMSKKLLKNDPNNSEYYLGLANDYIKSGDLNTALVYLERGLNRFPDDAGLIDRKAGVLADQNKYDELLPFLQKKGYMQKYNYYLLEAARHARNKEAPTLYGKVFAGNPGNEEAFSIIFNHSISIHQYSEALRLLKLHRNSAGDSKDLLVKELMVYNLMDNQPKVNSLTLRLFDLFPNDSDIQDMYVKVILQSAKDKMVERRYAEAIEDWYLVIKYGDTDLRRVADNSIYIAHLELGEYYSALNILNELILQDPNNLELYPKRAELYFRQKNYHMALTAYESVLDKATGKEKVRFLSGYSEICTQVVKEATEAFKYNEALRYAERWLVQDPGNKSALKYATNLSFQLKNEEKAELYAQKGNDYFPDEAFFKIKLAEIRAKNSENYEEVYNYLLSELNEDPYNIELINAHASISANYGLQLIKAQKSIEALEKLNEALKYSPDNRTLLYTKGMAFEKLKEYDSAYYYQSFYEPSPQEERQFKNYLYYLNYKSQDNEIGLYNLRSRPGDVDVLNVISSASYTRFKGVNTYTGLVNYAGRNPGKGFQLQGVWLRDWDLKTSTSVDAAIANRFFPHLTINASVFREIVELKEFNVELGIGYRLLDTVSTNANLGGRSMFNVVVGATKTMDPFRVNVKLNTFLLDKNLLYNITANGRYNLWSPKHYITAMAGFGSSPDIELIDYQVYNGFSALNTMVGAGFTYLVSKNVSAGVLGSWYNYKSSNEGYRNIHNLYFTLNVVF